MRILSVPVLFLSDLSSCDFIPDDDKRRKSVLLRIMMTVVGGSGLLFGAGSHYRLCVHINLEKWLMDSPTRTTGTERAIIICDAPGFFCHALDRL